MYVISIGVRQLFLAGLLHFGRQPTRRAARSHWAASRQLHPIGPGILSDRVLLPLGLVPPILLIGQHDRAPAAIALFALQRGVSGLLLAAPLLVPVAHFFPHFSKAVDPEIRTIQPLAFMPLNLVINDTRLLQSPTSCTRRSRRNCTRCTLGGFRSVLAGIGLRNALTVRIDPRPGSSPSAR